MIICATLFSWVTTMDIFTRLYFLWFVNYVLKSLYWNELYFHISVLSWIRNIATNVASRFTRTCRLFSIVMMSSKYLGNFGHRSNLTWSFEQVFLRFADSRKPSQFVNYRYGLAWLAGIGKSKKKLACKFHVKLFLCFCRKSCPHLGRWLNANLNGQFVIVIWRISAKIHCKTLVNQRCHSHRMRACRKLLL